LNLVQQQAENSRKRILFGVHNLGQRNVAYWSIDAAIASYGLADALAMPAESAVKAANMRTRLNPFAPDEIDLLLRAGYAGADASVRIRGLAKNHPLASFNGLPT
jgi:NTE family protein